MKNKTKILIFGALLLFVVITTLVLIINKNDTTSVPKEVIQQKFQEVNPRNEEGLPQAEIEIGEELAKADNILVTGVSVKNVYKDRIIVTTDGNTVFYHTDAFEFVFLPEYEKFMITISQPPAQENITASEQAFLDYFEINTETACKLNVDVAIPYYVDDKLGGQNYPLSFCQGN